MGRCKEESRENGRPLLPRPHDGMTLPGPNFRGRSGAGIGRVKVRVDFGLVWTCGLEHECDNKRKIVNRIEELIFYLYSNIEDLQRPDPWPTSGTVWMRPLWSPITSHTKRHLRDEGLLLADTTGGKLQRQEKVLRGDSVEKARFYVLDMNILSDAAGTGPKEAPP